MSVRVARREAEEARARMLELFPEGFEEQDAGRRLELAAYTDPEGEDRLRLAFEGVRGVDVAEGWESQWRAYHRPVRVGRLWIGPPWETPPPDVPAVFIDPGLAFGTGGHATTQLCIELLSGLDGGSLVDLGCGSGVLAIAAGRLGFGPIAALDEDPRAVEATARNARANGVEVDVRLGDVLVGALPPADVAVANVTAAVVEQLGRRLASRSFISSGYTDGERPVLRGFRPVERRERDGWAADLVERSQ